MPGFNCFESAVHNPAWMHERRGEVGLVDYEKCRLPCEDAGPSLRAGILSPAAIDYIDEVKPTTFRENVAAEAKPPQSEAPYRCRGTLAPSPQRTAVFIDGSANGGVGHARSDAIYDLSRTP